MAEKKSLIQKFQALLDERGWRSESELTRLHKFIHFWVLLGKSFIRNRCPIQASALSYTTLLALIPMLAVAISVTSSLLKDQGEKRIYDLVDQFVAYVVPPTGKTNSTAPATDTVEATAPPSTNGELSATNLTAGTNEVMLSATTNSIPSSARDDRVTTAQREAAKKIHEFISNIRSGTLGTIGMILLVVVGIRMLGSIESTFNDIWGVTRGRNWLSRVQIYCTTILLGPLLLAGAAALAGGPHLQTTRALITRMPFIGSFIFPTLTLLTLWLAFALFYQLVPNTKVKFSAALIGGIVGGSLWHLNNLFGFIYASRLVTNTNIYGSLALVPVFMAGLYFSWFILLFGAQVAYAFQNRTLYLQEKIAENVNQRGREFVALRLMTCVGQRFQRGLPPATIQEMSGELAIPSRLVQQVLQILIAAHLVVEVHGVEAAYAPARPLEDINAHHILQAMRATVGQELVTRDEPIREEVYGEFARIQEAEKKAAASLTMFALVNRAQARLEFPATKPVEYEIKMKPAFVPSSEGVAEPPQKAIGSSHAVHFSEKNSPDVIPAMTDQPAGKSRGKDLHANRLAGSFQNQPEVAAQIKPPEPENKTQVAQSFVAPPEDEGRDFPL